VSHLVDKFNQKPKFNNSIESDLLIHIIDLLFGFSFNFCFKIMRVLSKLKSGMAMVAMLTVIPIALWTTHYSIASVDSSIDSISGHGITLQMKTEDSPRSELIPHALQAAIDQVAEEMKVDVDDPDRCTLDGCKFKFPGPLSTSITNPHALPVFQETCLIPAEVSKVYGEDQHLPTVGDKVVGVDVIQCRNKCIDDSRCIAWTHDRSKKSLAVVVSGRSGLGACTLHGSFLTGGGWWVTSNVTYRNCCKARVDVLYQFLQSSGMFPNSRKKPQCTSGLVRAGRTRTDKIANDPIPAGPGHGLDLKDVNIAKIGQCHGNNCLDVDHCAARYTGPTKFAFIHTEDLSRKPYNASVSDNSGKRPLPNKTATIKFIAQTRALGADYLFVVPADTKYPLSDFEREFYTSHGAKIVEVPWSNIPGMNMTKDRRKHCNYGPTMDFIKTNVFGMDEYDALIVYDGDVLMYGDVTPLFKCAAQGYVLTTSGPNSPLNMGFLAFKPSKQLRQAAIIYGQGSQYSIYTGWNNMSFAPIDGEHPPVVGGGFNAAGCGQGFFYHFFYKHGEQSMPALERVFEQLGSQRPQAFHVDRCIWNYQNEYHDRQCNPDFTCSQVRVVHKKHQVNQHKKDHANGNGCFYKAPYNSPEALEAIGYKALQV